MSALPPTTDIRRCRWDVRKVPKADTSSLWRTGLTNACSLQRRAQSPYFFRLATITFATRGRLGLPAMTCGRRPAPRLAAHALGQRTSTSSASEMVRSRRAPNQKGPSAHGQGSWNHLSGTIQISGRGLKASAAFALRFDAPLSCV